MLHLLTVLACVLWGVGHDRQLGVHLPHLGRGVRGLGGLLHHAHHLPRHDELRLWLHQRVSRHFSFQCKNKNLIFIQYMLWLLGALEEYFSWICNCKALCFCLGKMQMSDNKRIRVVKTSLWIMRLKRCYNCELRLTEGADSREMKRRHPSAARPSRPGFDNMLI